MAVTLLLIATIPAVAQDPYIEGYKKCVDLYLNGRYTRAIIQFRRLLADFPDGVYADNCQFWIGESYFALGEYEQALFEFDRTLGYGGTNKREDTLYSLARCHEKLGESDLARELYARFIAEYPNSRHVPRLLKKLETLGID